MLPDGYALLREVDKSHACSERVTTMAGADGGDQRRLTHRDRPVSVDHGDGDHFEALSDLLGYLGQHVLGGRVRLVGQGDYGSAVVVVPDVPGEQDRGAGGRICHGGTQKVGVYPPLTHVDVPNL